jgi:hypothetical protein
MVGRREAGESERTREKLGKQKDDLRSRVNIRVYIGAISPIARMRMVRLD